MKRMKKIMRWPMKWLTLLGLLLASGHVDASDWTEGGWYYLHNTTAGQYLTGGNAWGTQTSVDETGELFQVNTLSDGVYQLLCASKGNGVFIDGYTSGEVFESLGYAYIDMNNQGHNGWQLTRNTGWSTVNWGGSNGYTDNFQVQNNTSVSTTPFHERRKRDVALAGDNQIYRTITGLPNGKYTINLEAFCNGGESSAMVVSGNRGNTALQGTGAMEPVTVEAFVADHTLTISPDARSGNTANWCGLTNVSLTYNGQSLEDFKSYLAQAKAEAAAYAAATSLSAATKTMLTETAQAVTPAEETIEAYEAAAEEVIDMLTDAKDVAAVWMRPAA